MELRVLRYFLAVAREQNITAAANSLHVTQPTLSKQLMDLEDELGKKLFIRGSRKITLTEDGEYLRRRAQEIVDLADMTKKQLLTPGGDITGDVYIGCGESRGMMIIAEAIKRVRESFSDVRFHIYSADGTTINDLLNKGILDFGFFIGGADLTEYDWLKLCWNDDFGLLMRRDSPLADKEYITPDDLSDIPVICSYRKENMNILSGWLGADFESLNIAATYNLINNAALMVENGIGYAVSLRYLLNTNSGDLKFTPFKPKLTTGIRMAWKKHQSFSKASELFLEMMKKVNTERQEKDISEIAPKAD